MPSATKVKAEQVASGIKKPGQTKEQTKLVQQGIQKGIEQYKKEQKAKARAADKEKKKRLKSKIVESENCPNDESSATLRVAKLPWLLLLASWLFFFVYIYY